MWCLSPVVRAARDASCPVAAQLETGTVRADTDHPRELICVTRPTKHDDHRADALNPGDGRRGGYR